MDLFKSAILGLVEGLTEFIPVSSTGHLILTGELLSFHGPLAETFQIFIQLGAILAVVVLYFERFMRLVSFSQGGTEGFSGLRGIMLLAIGSLPAFVMGAAFHSYIKEKLFSVETVAMALIVGGLVMLVVEKKTSRAERFTELDQLGWKQSLVVGLAQCFALWPGVSRSASTIIGGLLCGMERKLAAEFSFLLAVPVMCAAVSYDLLKSLDLFSLEALPVFLMGFVVSFFSGLGAIRFLIRILGRYTLAPFGWYRIVLGVLVLLLFSRGSV